MAKVQSETIWASDVKREAVAQGLIGEGEPLDVTSDLFRRVMDEVIDQKLLAKEAERRRLAGFIQYFERVTRRMLTGGVRASVTVKLERNRQPVAIAR